MNVIRTGLAASICISLLAACDGRGTTAFKSHRYTPEQYAERTRLLKEKAAREAGTGGELPLGPDGGQNIPKPEIYEPETKPRELPGAPTGTPAPSGQAPATPAAPGTTTTGAATPAAETENQKTPDGKETSGPSSKVIYEVGKNPEAGDEAPRKIARRDVLTSLVDSEVMKINAEAANILSEISFSRPGKKLDITMKAALLTREGQERFLLIENAPVGFDNSGKVTSLSGRLFETRDMKGRSVAIDDALIVSAYCPTNSACTHVHVVLDFAGETERIYAVFVLGVEDNGFKIVAHNLGQKLKPFSDTEKTVDAKGEQTNVGEAAIVGHEVAAFTDDAKAETQKSENQKPEPKVENQKVETKSDKAQVRQGETFSEYTERRKQETAANPLNLPEQPATVAELAKAGVAPASADLFAISSGAVDKFEFKPVSTATANSGKGPTVAAAAALPAKPATVAVATADGSMARAAQLRGEERTQEAAAAAAAINSKMAQQKSIRYNTKAKVADGSMASAAQLRAQERNQEAVAAAPKSDVTYAALKSVADARLQERKQTAAAAAAAKKVETAKAEK